MTNKHLIALIAIALSLGCNNSKTTPSQTTACDSFTHRFAKNFSVIEVLNWGPKYSYGKRSEFPEYFTPLCLAGKDTIRVFIPLAASNPDIRSSRHPNRFLIEKNRMDDDTKLPLVTEAIE